MIEKDTYCGRKFLIDGKEYIRIDGIWFMWDGTKYIVSNTPALEDLYNSYLIGIGDKNERGV